MKHFLLVILTVCSFGLKAQNFDVFFEEMKKKKSFTYGLNNRRTFLLGDFAPIYGGYVGIRYGQRLKHVITANSTFFWVGNPEKSPLDIRFHYVGLAEEFETYRHNRFALISYFHLGIGLARTREDGILSADRSVLWPIEGGVNSEYLIYPWLTAKLGVGYRYVFHKQLTLNGIYFKLGVGVSLSILRQVMERRKSESDDQLSPAD